MGPATIVTLGIVAMWTAAGQDDLAKEQALPSPWKEDGYRGIWYCNEKLEGSSETRPFWSPLRPVGGRERVRVR